MSLNNIKFHFGNARVRVIDATGHSRSIDKCAIAGFLSHIDHSHNMYYCAYWHRPFVHYDELAVRLYDECQRKGIPAVGQPTQKQFNAPISC